MTFSDWYKYIKIYYILCGKKNCKGKYTHTYQGTSVGKCCGKYLGRKWKEFYDIFLVTFIILK